MKNVRKKALIGAELIADTSQMLKKIYLKVRKKMDNEPRLEVPFHIEFKLAGDYDLMWSFRDILINNIEALEHLKWHDCDCHGHELRYYTLLATKQLLKDFDNIQKDLFKCEEK